MKWIIILLFLFIKSKCNYEPVELIAKTRTSSLEKYRSYVNVILVHLEIPEDVSFASFKFLASEIQMSSLFGCSPRKVSLFMKQRSPPVVNPDNAKYPSGFKNITRPKIHELELLTDNASVNYLNLTSPQPGCYFLATFLPYTDPRNDPIQPDGLGPECQAFVDVSLYIKRADITQQIMEDTRHSASAVTNKDLIYQFYTPLFVSKGILKFDSITFAPDAERLIIRVQAKGLPSENSSIAEKTLMPGDDLTSLHFNAVEEAWYYVSVRFEGEEKNDGGAKSNFSIYLKPFTSDLESGNASNTTFSKIYNSDSIQNVMPYKQYDLVRESTTESFSYSYELPRDNSVSATLAVNITSDGFTVLKFALQKHTDLGGILHFWLSFKPRYNKKERTLSHEPETNSMIACIRPEVVEFPTWPSECVYENTQNAASLILNKTSVNSTMMVPFPESGVWFVSFKLFCGVCVPCDCSNDCQKQFKSCVEDCEVSCTDENVCSNCSVNCKESVIGKMGCEKCDCDGSCLRNKEVCNSSVIFDLSSTACVRNCGRNGRCMFIVSDGIVYATCSCTNNYRGWDCSDDSLATPYYMVVLELLLLVLSNLMFLPTVYFAYRRKYYVEAVVYFSICFFSSFYHACDAGESIISFCLTRLSALQFADFFCALLSIWVTLIAIADLPSFWPTMFQIGGAIILAFTTTVSKTAVWGFVLPAVAGLVIVGVSWFFKYRKIKQMFVNKRYLYIYVPVGVSCVVVALVMFAVLETPQNYKYLHSMWHVMMAFAVIILLPRRTTFQPEIML